MFANQTQLPVVLTVIALLAGGYGIASAEDASPVAVVLEENAADLLKVLTNPTGDPGEGHVEEEHVFSGRQAIRIVPMQRFNNRIPGWAFPIREKPKAGEYRYLRFAWKAVGGTGIMLQLHDEKDWRIRYTAGRDMYGWGTKFVAEQPPQTWTVVTVDLFADHGAQTITGIALTSFDATAYFDHIYFARSIEELDRIDSTGFKDKMLPKLSEEELGALSLQLTSDDASLAYQAFWRLVAAKEQSVTLFRKQLLIAGEVIGAQQLMAWVKELDDDSYESRETAMHQLTLHIEAARPLLERLAKQKLAEESRWRIALLLSIKPGNDRERRRLASTRRVLEYIGSRESKALLEELSPGLSR